ncbi:MAG: MBL fold metallo-hydrolase [Clostridia bacterium]|nr:MBL fold metallo-hydrolase [Clostridia bacterium]
MNKNKKIISLIICVCLIISIIPFGNIFVSAQETLDMVVSFIDCGQGDSILISSEGSNMLIDAGKSSNAHKVTNYLDALGITELDYVVASHPDEDHIGGMPSIYEKYQINESIYSPYVATTAIYNEYKTAVKNEPKSNYRVADNDDSWNVGDAIVDVVYDGADGTNSNDSSLVLKVSCGKIKTLLTGDISSTIEQKIISTGENIDVDILKVAHHGSASSSSQTFLNIATPKVSVISVGANNSYGHPTYDAVERISSVCSNIYRTDLNGTIVFDINNGVIKYKNNIVTSSSPVNFSSVEKTVYVTASGKKYHASSQCSNMKSPISKKLSEAKKLGYTACSKCVDENFESNEISHTYNNACDTSCNVCGAIRKVSHKYTTTTTKATLSKNGKVVKKCKVCGKVASTTTIKYAKSFKLSTTSYTYNGKVKTPSVVVKDSAGKTLKKNTDYTVSYASGRKNVGTYKVTIKMKGKYLGTKTLTFKINPVKTSVSKLTTGKESVTVNISKKSTQVTGYQVQYSTSKKFTSAKTKTISSYKTTKYTLKSLSAKKTYYVRVRTYKTVNGKKYYSGWSSYKYIKTK